MVFSIATTVLVLQSRHIGSWDTSNVTRMEFMFRALREDFNQDISKWDTSNVTAMVCYVLCNAPSFNQDIGGVGHF